MYYGIHLGKSNNCKKCVMYYYWFSNYGFWFQNYVCNGCHDLTMLGVNISDISIITIKNDCCLIHKVRQFAAINLLKTSVLENRGYVYI